MQPDTDRTNRQSGLVLILIFKSAKVNSLHSLHGLLMSSSPSLFVEVTTGRRSLPRVRVYLHNTVQGQREHRVSLRYRSSASQYLLYDALYRMDTEHSYRIRLCPLQNEALGWQAKPLGSTGAPSKNRMRPAQREGARQHNPPP